MEKPNAGANASARWHEVELRGMRLWQSAALTAIDGLVHAFTPAGRNMSATNGPGGEHAERNRREVCAALDLPEQSICVGRQVHGACLARIGRAADDETGTRIIPDVDGLITTVVGRPLMAMSADCPVILLYDARRPALGLAHSGWRGTVELMPVRLVESLVAECGATPGEIIAVVSPSAGGCCYEVGDDVIARVRAVSTNADRHLLSVGGRIHLHLPSLIAELLERAGLPAGSIHLPEQCSICDERFCSYRRCGANAEHAALIAALR